MRQRLRQGARPRYFVRTNMNATLKATNKAAALEFLMPAAQANGSSAFDLILPTIWSHLRWAGHGLCSHFDLFSWMMANGNWTYDGALHIR